MDDVIVLDNLVKTYGRRRGLARLDLQVQAGEVLGFLGPNGAGKSTTIRLLLDLIRPTSGTVRVLGLDPRADAVACTGGWGTWPVTSSSTAGKPSARVWGSWPGYAAVCRPGVSTCWPGGWNWTSRPDQEPVQGQPAEGGPGPGVHARARTVDP